MTSRERVCCALNHKEPDRVPIFLGASGSTSLHVKSYQRLRTYLGFELESEPKLLSKAMQYVQLKRDVVEYFGADAWPLYAKPSPSILTKVVSDEIFIDEWGVRWELEPCGEYYFPSYVNMPLAEASIDDIENYPWPETGHSSRFVGLAEEACNLYHDTSFAITCSIGTTLCEQIYHMHGLANWMMDVVANQEFAHILLRKITHLMLSAIDKIPAELSKYLDVFIMGDDLGSQNAPLISPQTYRDMVKPYHAEIIAAIKAKTGAKVFFHSCGNVYPLIKDFIDIGVDILNPVQVSAGDMNDTARLKREFGDKLSFCGAIDSQKILPMGSPQDVRQEVRRRVRDLAPGGGYLCAAVHSIQPDVPLENIEALFDEVKISGRYPLKF